MKGIENFTFHTATSINVFHACVKTRVARWYISIPKFAVLVYFERPWYGNFRNGICIVFWYTLGKFLMYQNKNKIHRNNIKIITIVEIIIGIILKHRIFSSCLFFMHVKFWGR
jgi:hypothetical protein